MKCLKRLYFLDAVVEFISPLYEPNFVNLKTIYFIYMFFEKTTTLSIRIMFLTLD